VCAPRLGRLVAGKVTLSFISQAVLLLFHDGDSAPVAMPQRSVEQDTCTSFGWTRTAGTKFSGSYTATRCYTVLHREVNFNWSGVGKRAWDEEAKKTARW